MSDGREIIALVAQRSRSRTVPPQELGRYVRGVSRHRPRASRGHAHRLSAALRHDLVVRRGRRPSAAARSEYHYRFFDDPDNDGHDAVFGLDGPLHHLVNALKSAAAGYGIETPRAAAARPGRQQQEHDRPAAEAGPRTLLGHRRRRALHARLGRRGRSRQPGRHPLVPDERGAAAPHSRAVPRRRGGAS